MNRAGDQERTQRIRRGLTGLAVVFLFVLLASAISRSSDDPRSPPAFDSNAVPAEPNEPLAEIGAVPGTPMAENETVQTDPAPPPPPSQ